jgi:hypothetical protein
MRMPKTHEKNVDTNGAVLPDGWEVWPTLREASKILTAAADGTLVSHHFVLKKAGEGVLKEITDPKGTKRYDPKGVDDLKSYVVEAGEELKAPAQSKAGLSSDEFKAGTDLTKVAVDSLARMVPIMTSAYTSAFANAERQASRDAQEIDSLRARIHELEVKLQHITDQQRESMKAESDERAFERMVEAQTKVKDRAFSLFENKFLPVLAQKMGINQKAATGLKFLETVTREQMLGLLAIGVLTDEQRKHVLELVGELTAEEKAALENVSGETTGPTEKEKEK